MSDNDEEIVHRVVPHLDEIPYSKEQVDEAAKIYLAYLKTLRPEPPLKDPERPHEACTEEDLYSSVRSQDDLPLKTEDEIFRMCVEGSVYRSIGYSVDGHVWATEEARKKRQQDYSVLEKEWRAAIEDPRLSKAVHAVHKALDNLSDVSNELGVPVRTPFTPLRSSNTRGDQWYIPYTFEEKFKDVPIDVFSDTGYSEALKTKYSKGKVAEHSFYRNGWLISF